MKKLFGILGGALLMGCLGLGVTASAASTTAPPYHAAVMTTTTTSSYVGTPDESGGYVFNMEVVNNRDVTERISGIQMRLVEYEFDIHADPQIGAYVRTLCEWNTADANPMVFPCTEIDPDHYYRTETVDLPPEYSSPEGTAIATRGNWGKHIRSGNVTYDAYRTYLRKAPPDPIWEPDSFPRTEQATFTFD